MKGEKQPNQQMFPQFQEGSAEPAERRTEARPAGAPAQQGPAVYHRPGEMLSVTPAEDGAIFRFAARARESRLSYTHETALYLYVPAEATLRELFVRISFWDERVFRVTMSRDGQPADPFENLPESCRMLVGKPRNVKVTCTEREDEWILQTAGLAVHVEKASGRVTARDPEGRLCFAQKRSEFKAADIEDLGISFREGEWRSHEALELGQDEMIYGLGERFDGILRNGREVDFHNKDAVGTTSRRSYVNIPFYLSTRGYGLFLNSGAPTDWQIGTRDIGAAQFTVGEPRMDYFVLAEKTPKEILKAYCGLTGFAPLPPLWSFGLWMSRNSYTSWKVTDQIAREVRENDIPCDVLHLDTAWFRTDWNCDLKFSEERFPEPEKHLKAYRERGFHVSLWQYNFIPPREDNTHYREAVENGYLVRDGEGKPYHYPAEWKGSWMDDVIVDFSNPQARAWYAEKIRGLMRMGAGAIKTDFGEGVPEDGRYHSVEGKYFHNLYSLAYNATVFDACKSVTGENLVWARSGTAGSQRYPLHWGGDSQCSFEALAGTLKAALSIGISGIPFFSHDIGGFLGEPDDELYVRWAQLGLFSSHSRCHGVGDHTHREPWYFSEEACRIFRKYDRLRYSLMPYIYEQARECTETGLPMMRALLLEYPGDRNARTIEDEYLFGSRMLIAPVLKPLSESRVRDVYLPAGVWYDYFTREKYVSRGEWIQKPVDLETLPIYIRQGTVLRYCEVRESLCDGMGEIVRTETWED